MNAHTNHRRRAPAIILPNADRPIFASATEVTDIAGLSRQFDGYHASTMAAQQKTDAEIQKISAEVDKIVQKQAALALSGGDNSSGRSTLRAEIGAIDKFIKTGLRDDLVNIHQRAAASDIQASMTVDSDPDGGYFVLPEMSKTMTAKLWDLSAMRRLARVERTSASEWQEPIDSDQVGSGWVGEVESRPQTTTPKIGMLKIPLNELYTMPPVSQRLLDTAGFDLAAWVTGKITDRFGRDEGTAFISGNGVAKPMGLLSYPVSTDIDSDRPWGTIQVVPTGVSGDLPVSDPADALKTLVWSLRAPYRAGASWLMNSSTMSIIDKLKDERGNYLLRPGLTAGMPDMLLGYPVAIDDVAMPDIGANSLSIAFGNFKLAYVIVDGVGIRVLRDPFTAKPNVLFYAYRRVGGGVANSEAVKLLRFSVS